MLEKAQSAALMVVLALVLVALPGAVQAGDAEAPTPSITQMTVTTLVVSNQDEALAWYTQKLGFDVRDDLEYAPGARWLTVVPKGQQYPELSLEKATEQTEGLVGRNPSMVFATDDCRTSYETLKAKGVEFIQTPEALPWGVQATFRDLDGNAITLIQTSPEAGK